MCNARSVAKVLVPMCLIAMLSERAAARDLAIGFHNEGEIATQSDLNDAVGDVSYDVHCSSQNINTNSIAWKDRTVAVTLSRPGTEWRRLPILRAILNGAISAALARCPMTLDGLNPQPIGNVGAAHIFASVVAGGPVVEVAQANEFMDRFGYWSDVVDRVPDQEGTAAQANQGQMGTVPSVSLPIAQQAAPATAAYTPTPVPNVAATTLSVPDRWDANDYEPPSNLINGPGTTNDIAREFGSVHYYVDGCQSTEAVIVLTTSKFESGALVDKPLWELVRRAAIFAQERCPQAPKPLGRLIINFGNEREVYAENVSLENGGVDVKAGSITDHYVMNWWKHRVHDVWMLFLAGILIWLATKWEFFVRLYYSLTPHPAAYLVQAAVAGEEIDGKVFAAILKPIPGNRFEREVRARQATELAKLASESQAALQARADKQLQKLKEELAFTAAQRGMHVATMDAQLAKARADMLAKLAEMLKSNAEAK